MWAESWVLCFFLSLCSSCSASCSVIIDIYLNIDKTCMKSIRNSDLSALALQLLIPLQAAWPSAQKNPNQPKQKSAKELRRAGRELCFFPRSVFSVLPKHLYGSVQDLPLPTTVCVVSECSCITLHSIRHQPVLVSFLWVCLCDQWFTAAGCPMWAERTGPEGLTS